MDLSYVSARYVLSFLAVICVVAFAYLSADVAKENVPVQTVAIETVSHPAHPHHNTGVVISVCNKPKSHFCPFLYSAKTYGVPLRLINYGTQDHKNTDKLFIMDAELKKYSNDTVIVFSDCHDVVFNDNFSKMIQAFKDKNVPILLAVEYYCWPDEVIWKVSSQPTLQAGDCIRAYDIKGLKNTCMENGPRFVNSGTYIGYAGALKELIGAAVHELTKGHRGGDDDQRFFHEALLTGRFGAHADYCVEFYMCMYGIDHFCSPKCPYPIKHYDHLTFSPTSTRPFMVHFEYITKSTMFPTYINSTILTHPEDEVSRSHKLWVNDEERSLKELCP